MDRFHESLLSTPKDSIAKVYNRRAFSLHKVFIQFGEATYKIRRRGWYLNLAKERGVYAASTRGIRRLRNITLFCFIQGEAA
jgi:hypothetical protein